MTSTPRRSCTSAPTRLATSSTSSFSVIPPGPRVPSSLPPWPASMMTRLILRPKTRVMLRSPAALRFAGRGAPSGTVVGRGTATAEASNRRCFAVGNTLVGNGRIAISGPVSSIHLISGGGLDLRLITSDGGSKRFTTTTLGVTVGVSGLPGTVTSINSRSGPDTCEVVHSTPGSRSSTTRVVPAFGSATRICFTNLSLTGIVRCPRCVEPSIFGWAPTMSTNMRAGFSSRSLR